MLLHQRKMFKIFQEYFQIFVYKHFIIRNEHMATTTLPAPPRGLNFEKLAQYNHQLATILWSVYLNSNII